MKTAVSKGGAKKIAPAKEIEEYLAAVPRDARIALEKLRKTIKTAAPKAVEVIYYRIPTFKYLGPLVGFAAFPNHCSFLLMSPPAAEAHAKELEGYDASGATIRFTPGKPLPASLVKKLVKARIAENEKRAKK